MKKKILLGVSGGIAAYKSIELLRKMVGADWAAQVVMTEAATRFVGMTTFQALSGHAVLTDQFDSTIENGMPHIELGQGVDAIVIAPATADTLARLAQGRANDLLSSLCLARDCPLIVAPAMNTHMWQHPATQRNIHQLKQDGVIVIGPASGELACGVIGEGRMIDVESLFQAINIHLSEKILAGKKVLITAGPTLEPIDPVRVITNESSGKMGYAIAQACVAAGAEVQLVSGPTVLSAPYGVERASVRTAKEMAEQVLQKIDGQDIFISVAAVSDYRLESPSLQKVKKEETETITLTLVRNEDILGTVAALDNPPYCVGFAAETESLIEHAQLKRQKKGIPMIIANDAHTAIGSDDNRLFILDDDGVIELPQASKMILATQIVEHIAQHVMK